MLAEIRTFFFEYYVISDKPLISEYENFFRQFGDLTTINLKGIEPFISEIDPMVQRIQAERFSLAPRFNVIPPGGSFNCC
jgi:hypothetical protein